MSQSRTSNVAYIWPSPSLVSNIEFTDDLEMLNLVAEPRLTRYNITGTTLWPCSSSSFDLTPTYEKWKFVWLHSEKNAKKLWLKTYKIEIFLAFYKIKN